jgi:hypothetical protein
MPSTNGVLAKDSKIGAIKNYNYLPSVMDFTLFDAIGTFSVKMMDPGTRNGESI